MSRRYRLDWDGGAGASVDVFQQAGSETDYRVRFGAPFRRTMRAPDTAIQLTSTEFGFLDKTLREFATAVGVGGSRGAEAVGSADSATLEKLTDLGRFLYDLVLPRYAASDLRHRDLFLELGTDERLLHYPWELLHDGEDFLCLQHAVGRFVNLAQALGENVEYPYGHGRDLELKVLVVAVPQPTFRQFPRLPAVQREVSTVLEALAPLDVPVALLQGPDATMFGLRRAMQEHRPQVLHFCGHAYFDERQPQGSALALHDGALTAVALTSLFRSHYPTLCFVNGCETALGAGRDGPAHDGASALERSYNIYGLARPFLEAGSYLLGSRWRLADEAAAAFAQAFYGALLGEGEPIGRAILSARRAVYAAHQSTYVWASYVYYGDPRLQFVPQPAADGASAGPEPAVLDLTDAGTVDLRDRPDAGTPERSPAPGAGPTAVTTQVLAAASQDVAEMRELAQAYDRAQHELADGPERTAAMVQVVWQAGRLAPRLDGKRLPRELFGDPCAAASCDRAGERVVALALVQAHPYPRHLELVLHALRRPLTSFEQYQALEAAAAMVERLDPAQAARLYDALSDANRSSDVLGTDRGLMIRALLGRLGMTFALPASASKPEGGR